jgi:hypothetical protein
MVVQLKSDHCDPSEVKNTIDNLLHLVFYGTLVISYSALHELKTNTKREDSQTIEFLWAYIAESWIVLEACI